MDKYSDPAIWKTFNPSGEIIVALIVIGILIVLAIVVGILAKCADPLKRHHGLLFLVEVGVEFFDGLVENMMGKRFEGFGGFIMAIATYFFLRFIFGLCGLPSPITNLAVPLSLALITFILIHATSVKYTKFRYFKRYVEPFPVFLPINLISMWAPLLSMTLRLVGNALAGWTLMSLVYFALQSASGAIFSFMGEWGEVFIAPIVAPILHCYFDFFSGIIQTTIFIFLTMINIANEAPEEEMEDLFMKGGN